MITYKFQNETTYVDPETGKDVKWSHPFYSALVTAIGQSCTGLLYLLKRALSPKTSTPEQDQLTIALNRSPSPRLNPLWLCLPASFDIIETSFKNITLTLIAASVTQMLRSSVVFFTAMLALLFLKRKLY